MLRSKHEQQPQVHVSLMIRIRHFSRVWVLKDKLARCVGGGVGRELFSTYSNKNHLLFVDNLPRNHRRFSEKYIKFFCGNVFLLDSHKTGFRVIIFHQFSENFQTALFTFFDNFMVAIL